VMVDSNVLIDVITGDPAWGAWSAEQLALAADRADLVINPIVYGELGMGYRSIEALDRALEPAALRREDLPFTACFLAGQAYLEYRQRGGTHLAPLPDFYIGAHAAIAGYQLLTRDPRRYRAYFPRLPLIAPH
jgi:predicted nucleic acid-binding protein